MNALTLLRRLPQRIAGLTDVVLLKPRLREPDPDLQRLVTREPRLAQRTHQEGRRVRTVPTLEGLAGLGETVWQGHGCRSIQGIQADSQPVYRITRGAACCADRSRIDT